MHPETAVIFGCKHAHDKTLWLEIEHVITGPPPELLQALAEIGWKPSSKLAPAISLGNKQVLPILPPPGSLSLGWHTPEEHKAKLAAAHQVLRRFAFTKVPVHRYTLAELL